VDTEEWLSDYYHPVVGIKAKDLTNGLDARLEQVESIFHFVRDEIKFGFPSTWDVVKASEVIQGGRGYCTPKSSLFLALCKAVEIPARIHCGLISIEIMRGVFPSYVFPFLPEAGSTSWIDVEIDGEWKSIDSFINDKDFYESALSRYEKSGKPIGFSISQIDGKSSCEFNFGEKGFVHMGAVIEDHGSWDDFSEYMESEKYTHMNRMQLMTFPMVAALSNRAIERIRSGK